MAAVAVLEACGPRPSTLAEIRAHGELRVVTLNSPTTWYQGAHGPQGAQFELAKAFAATIEVPLSMYAVSDLAALRTELAAGRADMVAAAITPDTAWQRVGLVSNSFAHIKQLVVFRRGGRRPQNVAALRDSRVVVRAGSPQVAVLEFMKRNGADHLQWLEATHEDDDPVAQVSTGNADFTIVDANEFAFARQLYPGVNIGFELPDTRAAHWIVSRGAKDVAERVNAFFATLASDPHKVDLLRAVTADTPEFHYQTAAGFQADIETRLPALQAWFEEAAASAGVDWRLLAAIGYQESKWSHTAASGDGARGVMMLTLDTANSLGVTDRDDPRQSIIAGAKYFAQTRDKVPARIPEPDRSWMTIAAYNVGFGHLEDARILTQSRGKNPDVWAEVATALPLLAQERWYLKAKHGYARGWEPVRQVEQVMLYLNVLEWSDAQRRTSQ
ncbi:MAG: membrane-bound lytic murein transglycosylase MltF [Steroidobacteraceae bacterium]